MVLRCCSFVGLFCLFAPVVFAVRTGESCYLEGFSLGRGKKIYLLKVDSVNACSALCETVPGCTHWTFESSATSCILRRDDPSNKILIREHESSISAATNCQSTLQLANGENSCFSDGWVVSLSKSDQDSGLHPQELKTTFKNSASAASAEECQRLCQQADGIQGNGTKPCVLWEWEVSADECHLWGSGAAVRRHAAVPFWFSASPASFAENEGVDGTGGQKHSQSLEMKGTLVSTKSVVGPRVCPERASLRHTEGAALQVTREDSCTSPQIRQFPWISGSTQIREGSESEKDIVPLDVTTHGGVTHHSRKNVEYIETAVVMSRILTDDRKAFTQLSQSVIDRSTEFKGISVGADSRSPAMSASTDTTKSAAECQKLCRATQKCKIFVFYADGRSGGNCILREKVTLDQMFRNPVAIMGDLDTKDSLLFRGLKLGYEMYSRTIVSPGENYFTYQFRNFRYNTMYLQVQKVEQWAKLACGHLGTDGFAVIDYLSHTVHAVPSSDATERLMPMLGYISCSLVV